MGCTTGGPLDGRAEPDVGDLRERLGVNLSFSSLYPLPDTDSRSSADRLEAGDRVSEYGIPPGHWALHSSTARRVKDDDDVSRARQLRTTSAAASLE